MGTYYYWCNDELMIKVYLGRNINYLDYDEEEIEGRLALVEKQFEDETLFGALYEKTDKELTSRDKGEIIIAADKYYNFSQIQTWMLKVYFLELALGKGTIKSDCEDLDEYRYIENEGKQ